MVACASKLASCHKVEALYLFQAQFALQSYALLNALSRLEMDEQVENEKCLSDCYTCFI